MFKMWLPVTLALASSQTKENLKTFELATFASKNLGIRFNYPKRLGSAVERSDASIVFSAKPNLFAIKVSLSKKSLKEVVGEYCNSVSDSPDSIYEPGQLGLKRGDLILPGALGVPNVAIHFRRRGTVAVYGATITRCYGENGYEGLCDSFLAIINSRGKTAILNPPNEDKASGIDNEILKSIVETFEFVET